MPSSLRLLSLSLASLALASPFSTVQDYSHLLQTRDSNVGAVTDTQLNDFRFYVQYAAAAYCNFNTAAGHPVVCSNNACPSVNATVVESFNGFVTGIAGFVAVDDARQEIVLSFRGSSNIRNFIDDIVFFQAPCDLIFGCLLHAGFADAWAEIRTAATHALASAVQAHPGYRIVSTGHSLGAAVATIAAAYLRQGGFSPVDLYTYGSPRVGNSIFINRLASQPGSENRITHLDDPVPRVPPMLVNYAHTSPEYWLATGTAATVDYAANDVRICMGHFNTSCNAGTVGGDIAAHQHYFQVTGACGSGITLKARDDK